MGGKKVGVAPEASTHPQILVGAHSGKQAGLAHHVTEGKEMKTSFSQSQL